MRFASNFVLSLPEVIRLGTNAFSVSSTSSDGLISVYMPKADFIGSGAFGGRSHTIDIYAPEAIIINDSLAYPGGARLTAPKVEMMQQFGFSVSAGRENTILGGGIQTLAKATLLRITNSGNLVFDNFIEQGGTLCLQEATTASFPKAIHITSLIDCNKLEHFYAYRNLATFNVTNCQKLKEIILHKNRSFSGAHSCPELTKIFLAECEAFTPDNAISAFTSVPKLESLYLPHHHIIDINVINNHYELETASANFVNTPFMDSSYLGGRYGSIYVPTELLSAYQTNSYWSAMSARMVGLTASEFKDIEDHWYDEYQ